MTLEQIRIFMAVVEQGGVNSASKVLFRTQPAVSSAIARLEAELNVKLFSREGYRLTLNSKGRALHEEMAAVLEQAARVEAAAKYLSGDNEPEILISMEVLAPLAPLALILKGLSRDFSHTHFDVRSDVMRGASEKLENETVDFAIGPQLDVRPDFESTRFASTQLIAVGPREGLPSAMPHRPMTKEEMAETVQIVMHETTERPTRRNISMVGADRRLSVANYGMKKQLIIEGLGWGYMPLHLVEPDLADGALSRLEIEGATIPEIGIFALRKRSRPMGPAGRQLWSALCRLSKGSDVEQASELLLN